MSNQVLEKLMRRAKEAAKTVLLPEGDVPRVLRAAARALEGDYARIILFGKENAVHRSAGELGVDLSGATVVDPSADPDRDRYVETLYQRRRHKKMTREQAASLLHQVVYYGAMMVDDGRADAMVAGAQFPTRDTIRAALYGVGCAPGCQTISACNLMNTPYRELGQDGSLIFADTAVIPEPTAVQLAEIAITAAGACRTLLQAEPRVAMLSFSTKGSAHSPSVQKVVEATELAQSRRPDLKIDGELQLDAAISPEVAANKVAESDVAGHANTLVFPDLNAANIAYKLVQRLARSTAVGPLLLGLAKPINDLSRGSSEQDILLTVIMTALQAA